MHIRNCMRASCAKAFATINLTSKRNIILYFYICFYFAFFFAFFFFALFFRLFITLLFRFVAQCCFSFTLTVFIPLSLDSGVCCVCVSFSYNAISSDAHIYYNVNVYIDVISIFARSNTHCRRTTYTRRTHWTPIDTSTCRILKIWENYTRF